MISETSDISEETVIESGRFRLRLWHVGAWLVIALGLFVVSVSFGDGNAAEARSTDGVLFGAFARPENSNETQIEAFQELERQLGGKLPVARTFQTWEDNLDNRLNNWIVDGDRQLTVSYTHLTLPTILRV